ncbi:deoxyribonuclease IV [Ornithinibacter aureus]|uniref:Deoxyribonuclease IV n=2 Tax=Ornithinibacter aureus TaxID=622664 RepID=A0ABP8JIS9_9MICO
MFAVCMVAILPVGAATYGGAMALRIGGHVDQLDPVAEALARGATLSQMFLGDPQSYKGPVVEYAGGAAALRAAAEAAGVDLYVHAPYPINVASTNNRIRIPGRKLLQQHLHAAAEIGAKGVVVHGGHLGKDEDAAVGFDNWRKCIDGLDLPVPLLIENTAGGDNAMARRLEAIARLWDAIGAASGGDRVGFCLDTCHAHAGGNDLGEVVERVLAITGRIDLVHANDSRDTFDSGADRHTNFGSGLIDGAELADVVRAAAAPVVCETPGGVEGQAVDIAWLRARLG